MYVSGKLWLTSLTKIYVPIVIRGKKLSSSGQTTSIQHSLYFVKWAVITFLDLKDYIWLHDNQRERTDYNHWTNIRKNLIKTILGPFCATSFCQRCNTTTFPKTLAPKLKSLFFETFNIFVTQNRRCENHCITSTEKYFQVTLPNSQNEDKLWIIKIRLATA